MTRQKQRLERKRKKAAALLEITKLNDKDRMAKAMVVKQNEEEFEKLNCFENNEITSEENITRKRHNNVASELGNEKNTDEKNADDTEETESVDNKRPRLVGEEYIRLKQELTARKKLLKNIPRLRLKTAGDNASLTTNTNKDDRIPIFLSDVQHLLLYSLLGHHSPYSPSRWCTLEKFNKVSHTVLFVVEGLSLYNFISHESIFTSITEHLEHRLEVVTPAAYGGSVVETLATVPLTSTQSDKLIKKFGTLENALQMNGDVVKLLSVAFPMHAKNEPNTENEFKKSFLPSSDKFSRMNLLLSLSQMIEENYPVPVKGGLAKRYGHYVLTKDEYIGVTPNSPMFALDCEMCRTTTGELELTRVSLVDEKMNIIYESLVKPKNQITDYLTRYSGITEPMLVDVITTLSDVQRDLRKILPPDAILVGQSLNSDLHTLRMMHPYIIDTSVIFNITGDRYRKTKLQTLVREFLGEQIQQGSKGHCSVEDSRASMKLVQLKLANSIDYGDAVLLGNCDIEFLKMGTEKRKKCTKPEIKSSLRNYATTIFKHVTRDKSTAAIVGTQSVMNEYARYLTSSSLNIMDDENFDGKNDQVRLVTSDSNKLAVKRASEIAMEHAFTLCHIRIDNKDIINENIESTFRSVNKWIDRIWKHNAINNLTCVVFCGDNNAASGACFMNVKKDVTINLRA